MIPRALTERLDEFARQPIVLVACDYDGTLAPIVEDPSRAFPIRESVVALRALAEMHSTGAAVISGRSLRDLATLSRMPEEVHLVGSHGSEFDAGFSTELPHDLAERLRGLVGTLEELARDHPGAAVEQKPAGVAFHVRRVDPKAQGSAIAAAAAAAAALSPRVRYGKCVVEFSLIATDKGHALQTLRERLGADAVLFIGDDQTDEDAFAVLSGPDLAVKVGDEQSIAPFRVDDPLDVARLLARLAEQRALWLHGGDAPALQELSPLANGEAIAMIDDRGDLCWLCHPRPDSPSVFASLIGGDAAGYWRVRPVDERRVRDQRYLGDSMTLETSWAGVVVTDTILAPHPGVVATRLLRSISTRTPVRVEFAPRGDFGRAPTSWVRRPDGITAHCGQATLDLQSPGVEWHVEERLGGGVAIAGLNPTDSATVDFDLVICHGPADRSKLGPVGAHHATTDQEWSEWAAGLDTDDPIVRRSALVLKALCYRPTGAVLAAATTSLPEVLGGTRNWDYRFCWPRDGAYICRALLALGSTTETIAFLDWLAGRIALLPSAAMLRPLYPLDGDEYVSEGVISTLTGYRGSRPVRVGNLAEHQLQLDMFGPILDLIAALQSRSGSLASAHLGIARAVVDAIVYLWCEPDHGIWEQRRAPRHHVHSKAMCWTGVDRGISILTRNGDTVPSGWEDTRDAIRAEVNEHGWSEDASSYAAAYGEHDLDAALLQLATCGIFDPSDERVVATVSAVQDALQDGIVVYRYHHDDGLPGREGGFLICTAWLIEALVAIGRRRDAQVLYRRLVSLAGSTGTFTEQHDPNSGVSLGNTPQGYSHAGLVLAWDALRTGHTAPAR